MVFEFKISDLIKTLEEVKKAEGDIPVKLNRSDYGILMPLISMGVAYQDSDEKITDEPEGNTKVFYINY